MDGWKQALPIGQRMALRILKGEAEEIKISRFPKAFLPIRYWRNHKFFKIYVKIIFMVTDKEGPRKSTEEQQVFF